MHPATLSIPGLLGSAWLAVHLDRLLAAEEAMLTSRFGAKWLAYAAEVPRWPGIYAGVCLLLACACCGWIIERCVHARDGRKADQFAPLTTTVFERSSGNYWFPGCWFPVREALDRFRKRNKVCLFLKHATVADAEDAHAYLPVGLQVAIFVASQAQRVAFLRDQRSLFACGLPQDLKAALSLSCCGLLGRRRKTPRRLLCAWALLVLAVDLFLQLNAGVRLNLDLTAYGLTSVAQSAFSGAPALLLANLAMVPASTLPLACAMAPLAALLVRASDLRVRPTRLRLAALALAAAFAFLVESPCCDASQGISMRACREAPPGSCCEAKVRSQSPNVLSILAAVRMPRTLAAARRSDPHC